MTTERTPGRSPCCGCAVRCGRCGNELPSSLAGYEVVTLVRGDDWSGLYIGDRLVTEGHSVTALDALEAVATLLGGFAIETVEADQEWLESEGSLPAALVDVRRRA